ncbi:MAG: hypothetical protein PWQ29_1212 [Verrucomicrobiota bacterium]|jgi:hypothetical protein|nr:hypothetical protein [Verrucomicrobiota bacterium]
MKKDDARTTQAAMKKRKQVVRLSQIGYGPMKIAALAGLSWGAVNTALTLREDGILP